MPFEKITETVKGLWQKLPQSESDVLSKLRAKSLEAFIAHGLPTVKNEEWKYTNLIPVLSAFSAHSPHQHKNTNHSFGYTELVAALGKDVHRIHVSCTAGTFHVEGQLPPGVRVLELTSTEALQHPGVNVILENSVTENEYPFANLHGAIMQSGIVVLIGKGAEVEHPIHIVFTLDATEQVLTSPRCIILAEDSSRCTIIESIHVTGNQAVLHVPVCDVVASANSTVHYVKTNDLAEHLRLVSITNVAVYTHASAYVHTLCMGAMFNRNDVRINLVEPSAQGFLYGVSVLDNQQLADNHTVVDHQVPHCHSEELYKGVYSGKSKGVFNGKIYVREQAQKTTAYQSSHSLLLSDTAEINAKPQLEIWADDVKCSHGATMGQLNSDALFYLQARGISHTDAKALLTYAFAAEVTEHLPTETLRNYAAQRISSVLGTTPFEL